MSVIKLKGNPYIILSVGAVAIFMIVWYANMIPPLTTSTEVNMKELLCAGIYVAKLGGDAVKKIREEGVLHEEVKGLTKEGAQELKSDGDMASHNIMYYGLRKGFPFIHVSQAYTIEYTCICIFAMKMDISKIDFRWSRKSIQVLYPRR